MNSYVLMLQTDEDDTYITKSVLSEIESSVPVEFINSIDELDNMIARSGYPSVILLNDMGAVHRGHEVLKKIKQSAAFSHIPVVMLGEVTTEDYIKDCYRAGANTYIVKPSTVAGTRKKIETFFRYWVDVAEV